MKKKASKSIDQQWASRRCWSNKGRLASAYQTLRLIAEDDSTLPGEADTLRTAAAGIIDCLRTWDSERTKKISKQQFRLKRGHNAT